MEYLASLFRIDMKPLFTTLFALLCISFTSSAQNCIPDNTLSDTLFGVFPMPYHAESNPMGGIRDTACESHTFEFVLTTQVGDSFRLGQTAVALDSLWLDKESAVTGLPKGLKYACNPPSCVFKKQTTGCVKIYGVVEKGTEGLHQMELTGKLYAAGSSFGLPLSFPDDNIAPGEYALIVGKPDESPCQALSTQVLLAASLNVFPNPVHTVLSVENAPKGMVQIVDLYGRVQYEGPINGNAQFNLEGWSKGMYLLQVQSDMGSQQTNFLVD